ncbi:hypothetical protein TWF730_006208 [Orbilia blumenaviensis]|uniref:Heterokaryon incompatibility domain-containing protein n=1 Tax=Orbilia blumenaviensis TaxID=1796055 RepID=A0AAV9VE16_9PEZI
MPPPQKTTSVLPTKQVIFSWKPSDGVDFSYNGRGKSGAFRVISVNKLLQGEIEIWEYKDIKWAQKDKLRQIVRAGFMYTAISHVWDAASDVKADLTESKQKGTAIDIETNSNEKQTISMEGLQDVAYAVKKSTMLGGASFLWLDLLCLDQPNSKDKLGQICLMADIYKHSKSVVVMIGGVGSVHGVENPTGWIDRAWTLQEAVLNRKYTYAYVKWESTYPNPVSEIKGGRSWRLEFIKKRNTADLCLIDIRELLDMADAKLKNGPRIRVVDGMTPRAGDVPRRALRAAMSNDIGVRYTGMWRSLFLRTSSRPVDVIYSAMGCFRRPINPGTVARLEIVPVDPYLYNRSPMYVFNDFCRKMATQKLSGLSFLAIGGVEGNDIPYQDQSFLPMFPHTEGANQFSSNTPPVLTFSGISEWVGFHVADSPYYIAKTDVVFMTHSYPHVVNGALTQRMRAKAAIGSMTGSLYYWASDNKLERVKKGNVMALHVGTIGDMRSKDPAIRFPSSRPNLKGYEYLLFLEYHRQDSRWNIIGNGSFRPNKKWSISSHQRSVFTMGSGAQTHLRLWKTTARNWIDTRRSKLSQNSYGILPVRYFEPPKIEDLSIMWFGKKHQLPRNGPGFRRCVVDVDIKGFTKEGIVREFADKRAVQVVACKSTRPPPTAKIDNRAPQVRELGVYRMPFSFDGWTKNITLLHSKDGLPGILVPQNKNKVTYWVQIWFGRNMMYLLVKNYKNARRQYWDMTPIPYGPADGRTLNKAYGTFEGEM